MTDQTYPDDLQSSVFDETLKKLETMPPLVKYKFHPGSLEDYMSGFEEARAIIVTVFKEEQVKMVEIMNSDSLSDTIRKDDVTQAVTRASARIMNLTIDQQTKGDGRATNSFKFGYRDARHAGSEIIEELVMPLIDRIDQARHFQQVSKLV